MSLVKVRTREQKQTNTSFTVLAPSISRPKGRDAIRGTGEKFIADHVTGAGLVTVLIGISPGRSGFVPQFSFSYNSSSSKQARFILRARRAFLVVKTINSVRSASAKSTM